MNRRVLLSLARIAVVPLGLVLAGCAGYRGGWESAAYLESAPGCACNEPTAQAIKLPKLRLQVTMDNRLRTYDTQVFLFVLPVGVDLRDAYPKNNQPGMTRVFVTVTPETDRFIFRPEAATLHVGDKRYNGVAGFEFGQWDAKWSKVTQDGRWAHRPVELSLALAGPGTTYLLSIDFPTPVPSPEAPDIALDLSQALLAPNEPAIPLIRFAPVRWKEGYT